MREGHAPLQFPTSQRATHSFESIDFISLTGVAGCRLRELQRVCDETDRPQLNKHDEPKTCLSDEMSGLIKRAIECCID